MVNKGWKIAFEAGEIIGGGLLLASGVGEVAGLIGLGAEAAEASVAAYEAVATSEEAATMAEEVINLSPEAEIEMVNLTDETTPLLETENTPTVVDQNTFLQNVTSGGSAIGKTGTGLASIGTAISQMATDGGSTPTPTPKPPTPTPTPKPPTPPNDYPSLPGPPDASPSNINLYGGTFQQPNYMLNGAFLMQDYPRQVKTNTAWV